MAAAARKLPEIDTPWLTYEEAAAYTRKAVSTLQHLVSSRQIPVYGTRRARLFRRDMLDLWIENPDLALRKWKEQRSSGLQKNR